MRYRVLVLGAGGPAGVNTAAALRAAGHHVVCADANEQHLAWCDEPRLLMPPHAGRSLITWTREVVAGERIDLVWPQPDPLVAFCSQHRHELGVGRFALPAHSTVLVCQDKFETGWRWAKAGLRSEVVPVAGRDDLLAAADAFGFPFWLRATRGAGARGATMVESVPQAAAWLVYWQTRGVGWEWIAEEYLPGRDYSWAGVYDRGELVTSFARERLEYIYPYLAPSGRTGTPTVARIVHDKRVNAAAEFAVETIDPDADGLFCVDLREDADGQPRPTEINAGRTCTTVPLYHEVGVNVPAVLVGLFLDGAPLQYTPSARRRPDLPARDAAPEGWTLARHIDCGHVFTPASAPARVAA